MSSCSASTPGGGISTPIPGVVGTTLEFLTGANGAEPRLLTVVGVLPADFELPTGRRGLLHAVRSRRPVETLAQRHA